MLPQRVRNLDQEPTDPTYSLKAPAYAGIRTQRYMLTQYTTGETELYDMARDPWQLSSLHATPRFKPLRNWLLERLAAYRSCKGADCRAAIGPRAEAAEEEAQEEPVAPSLAISPSMRPGAMRTKAGRAPLRCR